VASAAALSFSVAAFSAAAFWVAAFWAGALPGGAVSATGGLAFFFPAGQRTGAVRRAVGVGSLSLIASSPQQSR
jgi:hypothetical protein